METKLLTIQLLQWAKLSNVLFKIKTNYTYKEEKAYINII